MPQENQTTSPTPPAAVSSASLFNQALAEQQQKNWDAALTLYRQTLDQSLDVSQAAGVYHNMSSIAYEKNDTLNAYIWSKKALSLDPSNSVIKQSFQHYSTQFQAPSIPHQISNYDNFKKMLSYVPTDIWSGTGLVLALAALWLFFRRIIVHRKTAAAGVFTNSPLWPAPTSAFFAVILIACAYVRHQDESTPRGLVVSGPAPVQTAPGPEKPVIFEAPSGLEVEVIGRESAGGQNYFQIRHPGAFSGWILQSQLELLSLSFEQKSP